MVRFISLQYDNVSEKTLELESGSTLNEITLIKREIYFLLT